MIGADERISKESYNMLSFFEKCMAAGYSMQSTGHNIIFESTKKERRMLLLGAISGRYRDEWEAALHDAIGMIEFCKTIDFKFQSGATAFYNVSHTSINVLNFKFQSGATAFTQCN